MKKIGVWLDREKAHIIILNKSEKVTTIQSEVENYHVMGGARSKTLWGPQEVVQDSKFLERKKNQLKVYFKKIVEAISDADAIVIFGPADTYLKFQKELFANYKNIAHRVIAVKRSDSMTMNQTRALVRNAFKN